MLSCDLTLNEVHIDAAIREYLTRRGIRVRDIPEAGEPISYLDGDGNEVEEIAVRVPVDLDVPDPNAKTRPWKDVQREILDALNASKRNGTGAC